MPAWAWIGLLAFGTVVVILIIAWLVITGEEPEEDPRDDGWDDDAYWSSDNPTPPPTDVPIQTKGSYSGPFPVHAVGDTRVRRSDASP